MFLFKNNWNISKCYNYKRLHSVLNYLKDMSDRRQALNLKC